ncbi:lysosome membrane protein 2-like [Actinia tenebrosa]|uniref:Lysosome membrane protein 2-like n=1 Tax=Actinia tenebrosa TaxID=6105 RepID=A0A6P8IL47_ACTTE|nr:lysosome membrane protein 2-like [Actinia tenebrosa]
MAEDIAEKGFISRWRKVIILFLSGAMLVSFGVVLKVIVNKIFKSELKSQLVISPDNSSLRYREWKFPTVPIHIEFYLFDIINELEVRQGGLPCVKQRGPYSYREFLDKKNITFDSERTKVSYNEEKTYVFDKELSCPSCDPFKDNITTINIPYVILSVVAQGYPWIAKFAINLLLETMNEDLIMRRSVQQIIWGYNDTIFTEFEKLKEKFKISFIPDVSPLMNLQPNKSFDGEVTVNTGKDNLKLVATWERWKNKADVGLWKTKYANMFNGSDGTQFNPGITKSDLLYFFSSNLCRSIYLNFDLQHSIEGIDVYRFTTPPSLFENETSNPDNKAFCLHRCYPNGILAGNRDCKPSSIESPIVISTPHFLLGDPYLRQQVQGLSPNKDKHGLFLSIEPMTGIPLQALIRLQINLHIQQVDYITGTKNIRESYVPVMYFSNNATVDHSTAKMLLDDLIIPLRVCFYVEIGLFCLGSLLILIGGVLLIKRIRRSKKPICVKINDVNDRNGYNSESDPLIPKS